MVAPLSRRATPAVRLVGAVERGGVADDVGEAELEALYRSRYASTVRLAGLLVGDVGLGEEIAQDAFARLFEVSGKVHDPPSFLRATVVNMSRSRIRRAIVARQWLHSGRHGQLVESDVGDAAAERSTIRQALDRLSQRQREAVVLRYYADLSETETAEAMGVTAGSVKSHLHRAMTTLAKTEGLR